MKERLINRVLKAWANSSLPGHKSAYRKFCRRNLGRRFQVSTNHGFQMKILAGDSVENQVLVHGEFEPLMSSLIKKIAAEEKYLIDVGCNIGYFSCLFATHAKGEYLSIDANPQMVERCQENMALNDFKGLAVNCAISEERGFLTLTWPENAPSHASLGQVQGEHLKKVTVPAKPLPELLAELDWSHRSVLKVDIEGFEIPLLRTIGPIIDQFPHIFFEYSRKTYANCGFSLKDLWELPWWDKFELFGIPKKGALIPLKAGKDFPAEAEMIWARAKD